MSLTRQSFAFRLAGRSALLVTILLSVTIWHSTSAHALSQKSDEAPQAQDAPQGQTEDGQLYLPFLQSSSQPSRPSPAPSPTPTPPVSQSPVVDRLLEQINAKRKEIGCPQLMANETLMTVAEAHIQDVGSDLKHEGTDGSLAGDRLRKMGINASYWGENLATIFGSTSVEPTNEEILEEVNFWADNPNTVNGWNLHTCEFTQIGIGTYTENIFSTFYSHYWVVVFSGPVELDNQDNNEIIIDRANRDEVAQAYKEIYLPTLKIPTGWDGDQTTCRAGTLSAEYKEAIRTQINYFRAMAGVPSSIVFKEEYNAAAQAAALIMHANGFLSHEPPPTSLCYTTTGSEGAGSSNLHIHFGALLLFSPIESYIEDEGPSNAAVGHRRWLLLTDQRVMGTGSVDSRPSEGLPFANATYVLSEELLTEMRRLARWQFLYSSNEGYQGIIMSPADFLQRYPFVTWPPAGNVPAPLVFRRWSIQQEVAQFDDAEVSVTHNGKPVEVTIEYRSSDDGLGGSALVWIPNIEWSTLDFSQEHHIEVEITNIQVHETVHSISYTVTIFDPDLE